MTPKLQAAFETEISLARVAYHAGNLDLCFTHLERAHILGQRYFRPHMTTHIAMLWVGWKRQDAREIFGQILRMAAVIPASLFRWVPVGNTGGANVSALKAMPIPPDLAKYFES